MKVIAYTVLLYGKEYLHYAIKSVQPHVDEHLILYTPEPSFSYNGNLPNPDTRDQLKAIADQFPHVTWRDTRANGEGEHRQQAITYASNKGYDLVLVVDSDEVWDTKFVPKALNIAAQSKARRIGIRGEHWLTFWKDFSMYVQDGFNPIRVHNLNNREGEELVRDGDDIWIYHCGYAISDKLMRYKLSCHGHKLDIPSDWYQSKWINFKFGETTHLHPATDAYWINVKKFDRKLPKILKDHPYGS